MKYLLITATLILIPLLMWSKDTKLGSVSKEMVQSESHPLESDAKAAVLCQMIKVVTKYDNGPDRWATVIEVFKRIKIYNNTESDRSNIVIPFYDYANAKETVSSIKGITFNIENGKLVESKLDKKSIFKERTSRYYSQMKIAMPNVKAGSVIEIKYKIKSPILRIPQHFFQYDIPCDEVIYLVETPEYFEYNVSSTGALALKVEKKEGRGSIRYTVKTDVGNKLARKMESKTIDYITEIKRFEARNVSSLKDEDFVPYMNNYRSSIKHELKETNFPGSFSQVYASTWDNIAADLSKDSDFGKFLKQNKKELEEVVSELSQLEGLDKAKAIFDHVQQNYRWNDYYGAWSYDGLSSLLKNNTGNIADINLLLTKLLKMTELEAYPVVTRGRSFGFMNFYFPSVSDLNYVLAAWVQPDGSLMLLDASSKDHYFGTLPPRALNRKGVIIKDAKGIPIDIINPNQGKTQIISKIRYDEAIGFVVNCQSKISKYDAIKLKCEYDSFTSEEEWITHEEAKHENKEFEKTELKFGPVLATGITLKQEYVDELVGEKIGDKIYIDGVCGFGKKQHSLKTESRDYPIFMDSKSYKSITVQLEIPEGYVIESLPESVSFGLPERLGQFVYEAKQQNNIVLIQTTENIKTDIVIPEMYPALREFYNRIVEKSNKKIVLRKV